MNAQAALALSHLKVVDLTTGTDGPFATKLLADLGARVIKVEPPEGDPARLAGPFPNDTPDSEASGLFLYLNANKEGIVLDLSLAEDRDALRDLARDADVLIENSPPGTMEELGLGYEVLAAANPQLVYTALTPFGQSGPYAHYRAPDIVRQAYAGWMVQGGYPEREPLRSGAQLSFYVAGVCGAAATMLAVCSRSASGLGQYVDVSAMEAFVTCAGQDVYRGSDDTSTSFTRTGNRSLPYGMFQCKDGWIWINILFQPNWTAFCEWAHFEDLLENPRYSRVEDLRIPGRAAELKVRITRWTMQHDREWLLNEGQKRGIAISISPTMAEVLTLPQHVARGFLEEVPHPAGTFVQPGAPFKMTGSPWALRKHAPRLGDDNDLVLGALAAPQRRSGGTPR